MRDPEVRGWLESFLSSDVATDIVSRRRWLRTLLAPLLVSAGAVSGADPVAARSEPRTGLRDPASSCPGCNFIQCSIHECPANICEHHECTQLHSCQSQECSVNNICGHDDVCAYSDLCYAGTDWSYNSSCRGSHTCEIHEGRFEDCYNDVCTHNDWCQFSNACQVRNEDCPCDVSCPRTDTCAFQ